MKLLLIFPDIDNRIIISVFCLPTLLTDLCNYFDWQALQLLSTISRSTAKTGLASAAILPQVSIIHCILGAIIFVKQRHQQRKRKQSLYEIHISGLIQYKSHYWTSTHISSKGLGFFTKSSPHKQQILSSIQLNNNSKFISI